MGSVVLPTLRRKREVDAAIRDTLDKVLVLRFGRASDAACLQLDDVEVFRGAMKGKLIVSCPLPPDRIPRFQLLFKDV